MTHFKPYRQTIKCFKMGLLLCLWMASIKLAAQDVNQPLILTPFNNQVISSDAELRGTVFSWSANSTEDFTQYSIAFYPVYPCQDPLTAFRVNHPIYVEYCSDEFFTLRENMEFYDGLYVWSVATVSFSSSGSGIAWSPPSVFEVSTGSGLFIEIENPCDTPAGCQQITTELDKEFPISIGVSISDEKKFLYPRALPIRAEGLDYDKVTFRCKGCSAEDGTEIRYYQDAVSSFEWTLTGKGSLGDPFKSKKLDSLNGELEALNQRIADLQATIADKQGLVDSGIDNQKQTNQDKIDDLNKRINSLDSLKATLDTKKDSLTTVKIEITTKLVKQRTRLQFKLDSLSIIQERIDTINGLLNDEYTASEMDMLAEIEAFLKEKERLESEIEKKEIAYQVEIKGLEQKINQAEQELRNANQQYLKTKKEIKDAGIKITELTAQLYSNSALRYYYITRNSWSLKAKTFSQLYEVKNFDDLYLKAFQKAEQISKTKNGSSQLMTEYKAALTDLNKAIEKAASKAGNADAKEALSLYKYSSQDFTDGVDSVAKSTVVYDTEIEKKIDSEKDKISSFEIQLQENIQKLDRAITSFEESKVAFDDRIAIHQKDIQDIQSQIQETQSNIASKQNNLDQMVAKRRAETEEKRFEYEDEVTEYELTKLGIKISIKKIYEEIIEFQKDSVVIEREIQFVNDDLEAINREIAKLRQQIADLEQLNRDLDQKKADLQRELVNDRALLDQLIEQRNALLGELEKANNARKTATGAYVYYIPPTLDELLDGTAEEQEFKRLVIKVEDYKDSVKIALDAKENLQSLFSKLTASVARDLIKIKEIEQSKEELEKEKKDADDKAAEQKLETGKKLRDEREKETEQQREIEKNKEEAKETVEELSEKVDETKEEMEDQKNVIEKNDSVISATQKLISDKIKEKQEVEIDQRQRQNNINDNVKKLAEKKVIETQIRNEIARANNDLSRASAIDNIAGIAAARKELNQLEIEKEENKKEVDFYVEELGLMADKLKELKDKIELIETETRQLQKREHKFDSIQRHRRQEFFETMNEYQEDNSHLTEAKKEQKKLDAIELKEEDKANIDSLMAEDEDLQEALNKAKEIDEKLKKLGKDADKAKANIETAVADKKKAEDKVKSQLKSAKDGLKLAKDSLKDFIEEQFEKASFNTKIKIKASDDVIDHWRSKDDIKIDNITLTYNKRLPSLVGPKASGSGAKKADPSKCYPIVENDKLTSPDVAGISAGNEPRTIALAYDEGRLLFEKWAVIPNEKKLLAKDVVVADVSIVPDLDEMLYECISEGDSPEDKAIRIGQDIEAVDQASGSDRPETGGNDGASSGGETDNGGTRTRDPGNNTDGSETREGETGEEIDDGSEEEEDDQDFCASMAGLRDSIIDMGQYVFEGAVVVGPQASSTLGKFLWEPQEVPKDKKTNNQIIKSKYDADAIYEDDEAKGKGEFTVLAGVMIETTETIIGSPEGKSKIVTRIVQGDHSGLVEEKIHLEVTKTYGDAEGFGFDESGSTSVDKETKDLGYLEETFFYYGKGYGKFKITVQWLRGGSVIEEKSIDAETPLIHKFRKTAFQVNKKSLDEARKMIKSGSANVDAAVAAIDADNKENWLIFGTINHDRTFANDIELTFKADAPAKAEPDKENTADFGIAATAIKDVPEETELSVKSTVPEKYKDLAKEYEADGNVDTKKIKTFKIGTAESFFVIELEEEVSPGEIINGNGTLSVEGQSTAQEIIERLKKVQLKIEGVELEEGGEESVAKSGKVVYESTDGIKFTVFSSFDFTITAFGVTAGQGGVLRGTVKHEKLEEPVEFDAEIEPTGNFIGKISNLPEIEVREFKLKKGSSIVIDMDDDRSKDVIAYEGSFRGIVIQQASLELPKSFNREGVDEPSSISVEDFYIAKEGYGGKIETKGQLLSMGFSGYELTVNEVVVKFDRSELKEGSFAGEIVLPSPMEGNVGIGITASESKFAGELKTDKPILLPQFKTTFVLKKASVEYDFDKEIGTLELSALINSPKFGDIKIEGFKLKSNGEVEAESISVEEDITIGGGFKMNLRTIGFAFRSKTDYAMNFDGKVDFKGILAIDAIANIKSGPVLTFEKLDIDFDKGPVNFHGEFTYAASVFEGGFDVQVKKFNKGIQGYIIVGNQKISEDESFNYWYGELSASVAIPIANTGFSFLQFGGGVGYNYAPPIGNQKGSPLKDGGFGIKALVGIGNAPTGEVLAGRMEMTYVAGNFSLYGKAWALSKEESLYGEGQVNVRYVNNEPSVDGYIAAFIGLTDAEGKLFLARGQVNFSFPPKNSNYLWTEDVRASLFQVVNANASMTISETKVKMGGRIYYDVAKEVGLGFGTLKASLDLNAQLDLQYTFKTMVGEASPSLAGNWDVNIEAFDKSFDVMSGSISITNSKFIVSPSMLSISGTASASYEILWYSGSKTIDIDYSTRL